MSFFNKFLNKIIKPTEKEDQSRAQEIQDGSIDEAFVKKFIHKGGKFLYCSDQEEVERNLMQVLQENQWNNVISHEEELQELLTSINSARTKKIIPSLPFGYPIRLASWQTVHVDNILAVCPECILVLSPG